MKRRKKPITFDQVTTRGGDTGESSIYSGDRYRKDDLLFDTLGSVDELSSFIGLAKVNLTDASITKDLRAIQSTLVTIGAEIATPKNHELFKKISHIEESDIEEVEKWERTLLSDTPVESAFVLPGGNIASATTDIARAVCRRAERNVVACIRERIMTHLIPSQKYLNRLSDYLFILARAIGRDQIS